MATTFGNTSIVSATSDQIISPAGVGSIFQITENGTADSLSFYLGYTGSQPTIKGVIWLASNGSVVAVGSAELVATSGGGWVVSTLGSESLVSGTNYLLGCCMNSDSIQAYHTGTAANGGKWDSNVTYASPNAFTVESQDNWTYCVYVTYTAAAGGLSIPVAMHHYKQLRTR